jgi:putative transcriptional regulator
VSLCDECRATVESFDTVGGALLEDTAAAELGDDSLAQTLAQIEEPVGPVAAPRCGGTLPAPVQVYVGGDLEAVKWRPIGMGVKQAILPTSAEASARLLFIPAGAAVPDHSHQGNELTLVLKGAFEDEVDRFARGDVETADDSLHHQPVADVSEDCICLAVTDAPLKFKGWLPRIVQRIVGI